MPSENITPAPGIRERSFKGSFPVTVPYTSVACDVRVGKGSRTANVNCCASQGNGW